MNNVDRCLRYWIEHKGDIEASGCPEMNDWLEALVRVLERGKPSARRSEDGNADIWVHCHTLSEIHLSAKDITQIPYPETVKLVLLLRPLTSRSINRSVPEAAKSGPDGRLRALAVDPVPGVFCELWKLIQWADEERKRRSLPGEGVAS